MENQILADKIDYGYLVARGDVEESENRSSHLLNEIHGLALFELDKEGQIISWNNSAARITGYSAEEILGQHFSILYTCYGTFGQTPQYGIIVASKRGFFEHKTAWRRRNGSNLSTLVIITPIDNLEGGFVLMVWDISQDEEKEVDRHRRCSPLDD